MPLLHLLVIAPSSLRSVMHAGAARLGTLFLMALSLNCSNYAACQDFSFAGQGGLSRGNRYVKNKQLSPLAK